MPDPNITPDLDIKVPMSAKTADRLAWVAWIMTILGAVGGAVAALALVPDFYRQLSAGVGTVLMVVAQLIQRKLPSPEQLAKLRKAASSGAAGLLAVVLLAGCPTGWKAMWTTTGSIMEATKATSKGGAAVGQAYYDDCLKKHGAKTQAYWTCMAKPRKWLVTYRDVARPAARSSVAVAYASGRTAEEAGKKPIDYMAILKPGGCALILSMREWGHKLPDQGKAIMTFLQGFTGMACDKVKTPKASAAAILTALLPVAVDLVKWIISLVGADNGEIKAKINKWIQAPAEDEVDEVLKKIDAAAPSGAL